VPAGLESRIPGVLYFQRVDRILFTIPEKRPTNSQTPAV
jgi:hypothetical protein